MNGIMRVTFIDGSQVSIPVEYENGGNPNSVAKSFFDEVLNTTKIQINNTIIFLDKVNCIAFE